MKLLVPLYDLSYASQVLKAASSKPIAVIVNVNDGPDTKLDKQWQRTIKALQSSKADVYGYVDLVTWNGSNSKPKKPSAIVAEVALWNSLYGVSQLFYDDWQAGATVTVLPNAANSIANPGEDVATTCGGTLIWETTNYTKSKPSKVSSQAVFAMKQADFKPALQLAKTRGVRWFYSVAANDDWHAYDNLPPYFSALLSSI